MAIAAAAIVAAMAQGCGSAGGFDDFTRCSRFLKGPRARQLQYARKARTSLRSAGALGKPEAGVATVRRYLEDFCASTLGDQPPLTLGDVRVAPQIAEEYFKSLAADRYRRRHPTVPLRSPMTPTDLRERVGARITARVARGEPRPPCGRLNHAAGPYSPRPVRSHPTAACRARDGHAAVTDVAASVATLMVAARGGDVDAAAEDLIRGAGARPRAAHEGGV